MQRKPNFDVKKFQRQWTVKYRSRSAGQGACLKLSLMSKKYRTRSAGQAACLKSMSRTITMQDFTLAAITDAEKTKHRCKKISKSVDPKYRPWLGAQGACLKGKSRTITM